MKIEKGLVGVKANSFYFDISGQTFEKTVFGSVGVTESQHSYIFNKLREGGRQLITNRRLKATKADKDFLLKIMRVLDENRIDMHAVIVSSEYWRDLKFSYQNYKKWAEKAYAYFYFEGFRNRVKKGSFSVTLCMDTFFDVEYASNQLYEIARSNRYYPNVNLSRSSQSDYLKLADAVARAVNLLSHEEISSIRNLRVVENPQDYAILNRLFKPLARSKR